jgi:hypothetical protein
MTMPYMPTPLAVPILNPAAGSSGASPLPYISNSQYKYVPTAMDVNSLVKAGDPADQAVALSNRIRTASRWVDNLCFGSSPVARGASLAANLSVESVFTHIKAGELRLLCDYKPVIQVVGIDIGPNPGSVSTIGPALAAMARIGRRSIKVPLTSGGFVNGRSGDYAPYIPGSRMSGSIYAVWSYVSGYPHTKLVNAVNQGDVSCVVESTDGNGGVWGLFPASGAFPGSELTVVDGSNTERVYVQSITTGSGTTTLGTTPFANSHGTVSDPDFIPVTAIPDDIWQAVISLTTMLIKTRGSKALVMPSTVGGKPSAQALAQVGATEDFEIAYKILSRGGYMVRNKAKT